MNALVLEGSPHRVMKGWTNFQIIIRHDGGLKVSTCIGQNGTGQKFAEQLRGKFFPAGTWEAESLGDTLREAELLSAKHTESWTSIRFPSPRPEILDELFRGAS